MLWYKAWLETRSRFLASLCGITLIVAFFAYHNESLAPPGPTADTYTRSVVFYSHEYLMVVWILCVILLGMGGLIRERAVGTSSLTLALPVSRAHLVAVHIALGVSEAICLGLVPWTTILVIMWSFGRSVLISQAGFYFSLLVSGGLIYFAFTVLISSLIEGEYTAPSVAFGLTILAGIICGNVAWLRPYADLWRFMGGDNHLDKSTYLLSGPFPWAGALASLSAAALFLVASVAAISRAEF